MVKPTSDIAFTPSVKAIQARKGSRDFYRRMEQNGAWRCGISDDLATFIADQRSFFLATASSAGIPYIQHRGGPRGFLWVVDDSTLAFVDFKGNRQYISQGNLAENPNASIFLIDYAKRQRIKIWGKAHVVEDDPDLLSRLAITDYRAQPEQAIVFNVTAWDVNCPQHIPVRFDAEDVEQAIVDRDARIADLESEIRRLRAE